MLQVIMKSLAVLGVALLPALASAQAAWPSKPITLVVPFPPGGSADVIGRLFATELSQRLGQQVVVDNKPGANTSIGAGAVARATPDGYTLMITGAPTFTTNSLLYPSLGYDPVDSFSYIAIAGSAPFVVLTNAETKLGSISDIVAASGTEPLSFGSFGTASTPHLAGESLASRSGASLLHVPYRGSAPAMTDLIGNQIPLSIDTLVAALPQVRGGKVKAIALTSLTRSALLPDVPTVAESMPDRLAGYDFLTWYGIVSAKGTPQPVVDRLSGELRDIMNTPAIQNRMRELGFEPSFEDAQAFRSRVKAEMARNADIIKRAGIQVQ